MNDQLMVADNEKDSLDYEIGDADMVVYQRDQMRSNEEGVRRV